MTELKLCKDCKWAVPDTNVFLRPVWNDNTECCSPKNLRGYNLVNGEKLRFLIKAKNLRTSIDCCGKNGDWWEPRS